jgi:hypothetical protein
MIAMEKNATVVSGDWKGACLLETVANGLMKGVFVMIREEAAEEAPYWQRNRGNEAVQGD